jgi:hypothetical protein
MIALQRAAALENTEEYPGVGRVQKREAGFTDGRRCGVEM